MSRTGISGAPIQIIRYDYTVNVTTGAWVQLDSSLNGDVSYAEIFDSSGETLKLGIGPSGSEYDLIYIIPGGNGKIALKLCQGQRLSVRAVSATASSGELVLNLYV